MTQRAVTTTSNSTTTQRARPQSSTR
jgi:hypothetical protein